MRPCPNCGERHDPPYCPPVRTITTYGLRQPFGLDRPLQEPSYEERIETLEREVADLKRQLARPLDCIGPDSQQGRGKISP